MKTAAVLCSTVSGSQQAVYLEQVHSNLGQSGVQSARFQPVQVQPQQQLVRFSYASAKTNKSSWRPLRSAPATKRPKDTRKCRVNQLRDEAVRTERCLAELDVQLKEKRTENPVCRWEDEYADKERQHLLPKQLLPEDRRDRLVREKAAYEALEMVIEPVEQLREMKEMFLVDNVHAAEMSAKSLSDFEQYLKLELASHEAEERKHDALVVAAAKQQQYSKLQNHPRSQTFLVQQGSGEQTYIWGADGFVNPFLGGQDVVEKFQQCLENDVAIHLENAKQALTNVERVELVTYRSNANKVANFNTHLETAEASPGFAWMMDYDHLPDEIDFLSMLRTEDADKKKSDALHARHELARNLDQLTREQNRETKQDMVAGRCDVPPVKREPVVQQPTRLLVQQPQVYSEQKQTVQAPSLPPLPHPSQEAQDREEDRHNNKITKSPMQWSEQAKRLEKIGVPSMDTYNFQRVMSHIEGGSHIEDPLSTSSDSSLIQTEATSLAGALKRVDNLRVFEFPTPDVLHHEGYTKKIRVGYTDKASLEKIVPRVVDRAILLIQSEVNRSPVGTFANPVDVLVSKDVEGFELRGRTPKQLADQSEVLGSKLPFDMDAYRRGLEELVGDVADKAETLGAGFADSEEMKGPDARDPQPVEEPRRFMLSLDDVHKGCESDMQSLYDVVAAYDYMSKVSSRKNGEADESYKKISCQKVQGALRMVPDSTNPHIYEVKQAKKEAQANLRLVREKVEQLYLALAEVVPDLSSVASTATVLADRYTDFANHVDSLRHLQSTKTPHFDTSSLPADIADLLKVNAVCLRLREKAQNIKARGEKLLALLRNPEKTGYLTHVYSKIESITVEAKELIQAMVDAEGPFRYTTNEVVCNKPKQTQPTYFWDQQRGAISDAVRLSNVKSQVYNVKKPVFMFTAEKSEAPKLQKPPPQFFRYDKIQDVQLEFVQLLNRKEKTFKLNLDNIVAVKEHISDLNTNAKTKLFELLSRHATHVNVRESMKEIQRHVIQPLNGEITAPSTVTLKGPTVARRPDHLRPNFDRSQFGSGAASHNEDKEEGDKVEGLKTEDPEQVQVNEPKSSAVVLSLLAVVFSLVC